MKGVKIADLKSHLAAHLRTVRRGRTIVVLDRDTPIARIVPLDEPDDLVVARPARGAPAPGKVRLPPKTGTGIDAAQLVIADRRRRRW